MTGCIGGCAAVTWTDGIWQTVVIHPPRRSSLHRNLVLSLPGFPIACRASREGRGGEQLIHRRCVPSRLDLSCSSIPARIYYGERGLGGRPRQCQGTTSQPPPIHPASPPPPPKR